MEQTQTEKKTYEIAGITYRLEPGSIEQHEWLADGPLRGMDFGSDMSQAKLEPIIQRRGTEILGMVLIAEGITREQKCEAGLAEATALGLRLKRQMTPQEVRDICIDFFPINGFKNMWFFVDFQALAEKVQAERIAEASSPASASLPMVTAPSAEPSGNSADPSMQNSTLKEGTSAAPSSEPSLVSTG